MEGEMRYTRVERASNVQSF